MAKKKSTKKSTKKTSKTKKKKPAPKKKRGLPFTAGSGVAKVDGPVIVEGSGGLPSKADDFDDSDLDGVGDEVPEVEDDEDEGYF